MTEQRTPRQAAVDWLLFLRDDPDDEELKARFREWLAEDPAHEQAWANVNKTTVMLTDAPQALWDETPVKKMKSARQIGSGWLRRLLWPVAGASVAVACGVALLATPDLLLRLKADQYTPVGTTKDVLLADGSHITLAPRSAIKIEMAGTERHIRLLQGEALFDVRHDESRPFRVFADDFIATDIGTVFDVRTDATTTAVAVRQGVVHVASLRVPAVDRDLHAGEWVRIANGQPVAGTSAIEAIGAWRNGTLITDDEAVSDVIAALRPWTTAKIVVTGQKLADKRVTGNYDLRQPEASLRLLVATYGGKVRFLTPWLGLVTDH
ncbi:FecR family protein [Acetobacter syzygii]|uniref:FecR family protein n=1 Tax=Acetobacter syzygii TaxID=146476 RepID=UPI00156E5F50|nr:FecR domain-containing protein [Acetobacter syzygii]NSL92810.1 FecR domain-containing protein [Acetobacter syzygii]